MAVGPATNRRGRGYKEELIRGNNNNAYVVK